MVYGIVIATKTDGTKTAVGGPMPLSQAKALLKETEGEDLQRVELFELRQPSKRRKLNRVTPEAEQPLTPAGIAEKIASGEVAIPEDGLDKNGILKVGVLNKLFGTKFKAADRDEIWAMVQEIENTTT